MTRGPEFDTCALYVRSLRFFSVCLYVHIVLRISHCLSLGVFSLYLNSHLVSLSSSFTDFGRLRTNGITWLRLVCEARCIKGRQCCYISCHCCCIRFTSKYTRSYKESYSALHLSLCICMSVWLLRERKSRKKKDFPKNQGTSYCFN